MPDTSPGEMTAPPLRPMDTWERASAILLMALGVILTLGTLVWFGLDHKGGGGFVSKVTETDASDSTQRSTVTEYSDTVVIFALASGAGLILAGGLYGRLRDFTLGPLKVGVAELPKDEQ
jgi:hypothetical protein